MGWPGTCLYPLEEKGVERVCTEEVLAGPGQPQGRSAGEGAPGGLLLRGWGAEAQPGRLGALAVTGPCGQG